MATIPRFLAGNYGNGVIGLKTSLPGYDVTVLADDNDPTKRSFNSEWAGIARLKMVGRTAFIWQQQQWNTQLIVPPLPPGTVYYYFSYSWSAWVLRPVPLATGLNYMPIWEERLYDPSSQKVYDDYVYPASPSTLFSFSGARSFFSGPGLSPANTIWFEYLGLPDPPSTTHYTPEGYPAVANVNVNSNNSPNNFFPPYPSFPSYPALPSLPSMGYLYNIYLNKAGDIS